MISKYEIKYSFGDSQKKVNTENLQIKSLGSFFYGNGVQIQTESVVDEIYNNPIVYGCIERICEALAALPIDFVVNGDVANPPANLQKLIEQPTPLATKGDIITGLAKNILLFGNAFLWEDSNGVLLEVINFQDVQIHSRDGRNAGYSISGVQYKPFGATTEYFADANGNKLHHYFKHNPTSKNYYSGFYNSQPIAEIVNIFNQALKWQKSLLNNSATPSGTITMPEGMKLSPEEFERLKQEMINIYTSSSNAGKPMLLEGGLQWAKSSFSPNEMAIDQVLQTCTELIAAHFRVPKQYVGLDKSSTYNNVAEARIAFYQNSVLPLMDSILSFLTNRVIKPQAPDYDLKYSLHSIPAMQQMLYSNAKLMQETGAITINESRASMGLEPVEGGNKLLVDASKTTLEMVDYAGEVAEMEGSLNEASGTDKESESV